MLLKKGAQNDIFYIIKKVLYAEILNEFYFDFKEIPAQRDVNNDQKMAL